MINGIRAHNFKSWEDTGHIRFAPITGLFGSNSSGKTSLLQLILMLKQTADSSDRGQVVDLGDERSLVELGTFQDILFSHEISRALSIELNWKLDEEVRIEDPTKKKSVILSGHELVFSTSIELRNVAHRDIYRAFVREMSYGMSGEKFGMKEIGRTGEYELFSEGDFSFKRVRGRIWKLPPPAKCYGFPDQVRGYFQNAGFLSDFELRFEELFRKIFYLGPLRDYPKRQYQWAGALPTDMGRRGERVVEALLASRDAQTKISRGRGVKRQTLEERVAEWLKDLGLITSFSVRPIVDGGKLFQVWVKRSNDAAEVLITDVGFGVSQILPVITLCYYAPEGSTIILEQPEIHLHPSVQAGLADIFIDVVKTRKIQIILESHSEHLLRRLQRRIAEDDFPSRDAELYFCDSENGKSRLTKLNLDVFGNIANWPKDFFGDEFGEIAMMQKAIIERKRKG